MFRSVRSALVRKHRNTRRLTFESMEARRLLAGDVSPWHNAANPFDVTGEGFVTAADALHVFHYVEEFGDVAVPADAPAAPPFFDVNNDMRVNAADVALIIGAYEKAGDGILQNPVNALDANDNGVVNIDDALAVQDYLRNEGWGSKPHPRRGQYLDVNGDGAVTVADQYAISTFLFPQNTAPVAIEEARILVDSGRPRVVKPQFGLLPNDTDANGDPLRVVLVAGPTNGTLVLEETGGYTYTPNPGFIGEDSFTYQVDDGRSTDNLSNVVTAKIKVRDSASNPVARPDAYWVASGQTLTVDIAAGLLDNDTAMQGTIEAVRETNPSHGKLVMTSEGSLTYEPDDGFVGTDSFTYFVLQHDPTDPHPYRWSDPVTVEIVVEDPAQNAIVNLDVTSDGMITAKDALTVINHINAGLGTQAEGEAGASNLDVTRNGAVTAADALAIINYLNAGFPKSIAEALQASNGEGEASSADDEFLLLATDAAERNSRRR